MPRASPSSTAATTSGWPCPSRLAPNDMQKSMYSLPSTSQMREPFAARRHERPPGAAVQARGRRDAARAAPAGLLEVLLGARHFARLLHHRVSIVISTSCAAMGAGGAPRRY